MKAAMNYQSETNSLKQELEKLKADYQNLFDENPLAMFVADNNTSKFIGVNKAALAMYGYTQQEFLKLTLEDVSKSPCNVENTSEGSSGYTCHYKKGGEVLYVEVKKNEIVYKNVPSQLITTRDVTEKVVSEEKEKKAKQRLDAIFTGTHDAILLADDNGKYMQVNKAACSMLEYTEAELLSLSVADIVVSVKAESAKAEGTSDSLWNNFINTGNQSGIVELKKKSGEIIICHYNATTNVLPGLHLSILSDITEREIARRKIEEQGKRIENILESITDGFFALDTKWEVKYWNKTAEQLLEVQREKIVGHNLWEVFEDAKELKSFWAYNKAMNDKIVVHFEDYYPTLNKWFDVSAYPGSDGITVYFKDITFRKKQASEILQARNNQAALINSSNDLIWSIDTDMKLVSFNTSYKKTMEEIGITVAEGLQLPFDYHSAVFFEQWRSFYKRGLAGESFSEVIQVFNPKTGKVKHAEITFNPIFTVGSTIIKGLACYSRNITERVQHQLLIEEQNEKLKSNEEHLQKLTTKLEKIMSASPDIICTLDIDGRFVQVSEACKQVLGYIPAEMIGKLVLDFVTPEYLQLTKDASIPLAEGKDLISFQNACIHKSGKRVPINWSARFDSDERLVVAVARDASLQVEAEKMKAVAEQRFTSLVQNGSDMVGIIDTEGNYTFVSPNFERVLGIKPEFLLQKNSLSLIHPDDLHIAHTELEKVIKGSEVKLAAFRHKNASGEWRWIETIATNQLDDPAINGIVINSRDITSRKEIETERELMIKELLNSNADLKQFSFITSHNLRAPLSNIIGILNIIDYPVLDDYNKQMIEMLGTCAKQSQQTIDDLSKILVIRNNINIETSKIDMEEAVEEVKTIFINTINDVCADIFTDFKIKEIQFNKTYLQSILVNLVSNSIKYQSPKRNLVINVSTEVSA
ncbi:MAG: hypothetical protein JWQ09_348, partial [Segetibacter sp.]|nr:hypothetical protein [Segetibacter sp.]